jgi:hypothetical protein
MTSEGEHVCYMKYTGSGNSIVTNFFGNTIVFFSIVYLDKDNGIRCANCLVLEKVITFVRGSALIIQDHVNIPKVILFVIVKVLSSKF